MDYLPRPDKLFLAWLYIFVHYLSTAFVRLKFPEEIFTDLLQQHADFEQKLQIAEDPSTHTPVTVATKNAARKLVEKTVRQAVKEHLINNHLLTAGDFKGLGLPVHKTSRTPVPVPTKLVAFFFRQLTGNRVEAHFSPYDEDAESKKKSEAKEYGTRGVEFIWAILPEPPKSRDELVHSVFDTHSPITWQFDLKDAGRTLYVCGRWENNTGQKGPWSDIQSTIIP
jgi:hypothetical protein